MGADMITSVRSATIIYPSGATLLINLRKLYGRYIWCNGDTKIAAFDGQAVALCVDSAIRWLKYWCYERDLTIKARWL